MLLFRYRVVQLNQLSWRDYLKRDNPVATALMAKMRIAPEDRRKVKAECLRLLLTLRLDKAKMGLIAGFVNTYLKLPPADEQWVNEELEALDPKGEERKMFWTHWHELGMEEGLQKGVLQGIEQGLEQGKRQEALGLVLRQTRRMLGPAVDLQADRLKLLSTAQLEKLAEDLLDFKTIADLQLWLDRTPPSTGPQPEAALS